MNISNTESLNKAYVDMEETIRRNAVNRRFECITIDAMLAGLLCKKNDFFFEKSG
jgi:hypothetical protein